MDVDLNEIVEFVVGFGGGLGNDGVAQRGDGADADIVPVVAHHAAASEIVVGARGFVAGVDGGGSGTHGTIFILVPRREFVTEMLDADGIVGDAFGEFLDVEVETEFFFPRGGGKFAQIPLDIFAFCQIDPHMIDAKQASFSISDFRTVVAIDRDKGMVAEGLAGILLENLLLVGLLDVRIVGNGRLDQRVDAEFGIQCLSGVELIEVVVDNVEVLVRLFVVNLDFGYDARGLVLRLVGHIEGVFEAVLREVRAEAHGERGGGRGYGVVRGRKYILIRVDLVEVGGVGRSVCGIVGILGPIGAIASRLGVNRFFAHEAQSIGGRGGVRLEGVPLGIVVAHEVGTHVGVVEHPAYEFTLGFRGGGLKMSFGINRYDIQIGNIQLIILQLLLHGHLGHGAFHVACGGGIGLRFALGVVDLVADGAGVVHVASSETVLVTVRASRLVEQGGGAHEETLGAGDEGVEGVGVRYFLFQLEELLQGHVMLKGGGLLHGFDFLITHPNGQLVLADLDKVLGIEENEGEVFLFAKVVLSVVQATNHTGGGRGDLVAVGVYFCADGGYVVGAMEFGL